MEAEQVEKFSLECINLAELERRSEVSSGKLRRLKRNGFRDLPCSTKGRKHTATKLSGYTGLLGSLLRQGIKNSSVVLERLQQARFDGGATIVKNTLPLTSISSQPSGSRLLPRETEGAVTPQAAPGEAYQMDWASQMCWTTTETPTMRHALL